MSIFGDLGKLPEHFSGVAKLFPLPDLVLFPHVIQPLHIFEPRYRDLLADALEGDQLIAMSLLRPGWQKQYEGDPPVERVVCLGRIVSHWQAEAGTSNILLLGLQRASISHELPKEHAYRRATVKVLEDVYPAHNSDRRPLLRRELLDAFRQLLPSNKTAQEQFELLLSNQIPLGMLTDIVAYSLKLSVPFKQALLAEWDVDRRATMLLEKLGSKTEILTEVPSESPRRYPVQFSVN